MSSRSHPDCTFFCLCSFEYTKTASHRRTVQFRLKDLQIHDKHSITPHDAPDHIFLSTKAITLSLDTQKNSVRGESSSMEATGVLHGDPVSAAARRYLHLRANHAPPNTPICSYYPTISLSPQPIKSRQITSLLRLHAAKIGFQRLGFYPHEIGTHSLRSGGTMTL